MTSVPSYPAPTLVDVNINSPARANSSAGPDTGDGSSGASSHRNRASGLLARARRLDAPVCAENAPRGAADVGQPKTGTANPTPQPTKPTTKVQAGRSRVRARLWAPGAYRQPPQGVAMDVRVASSRGNGQSIPNTKEAA